MGTLNIFSRVNVMSYQNISIAMVIVLVSFIGFGDKVLPESVGQHSETMRSHLLGMLPSIRPQNNNAKTEEAVDNLGL